MGTAYETDIVAWAREQAALLRSGQLSALDIEHIAEEIEDVGKSEKRELASRMAVLLAHLLKWQHQPGRRGSSWTRTLKEQRKAIAAALRQTPSLKASLTDADWLAVVWAIPLYTSHPRTSVKRRTCPRLPKKMWVAKFDLFFDTFDQLYGRAQHAQKRLHCENLIVSY